MKLASIIIPYYKKKNYIKRTIKSALNQTYKNIEIILIYDDLDKKELFFLKKNYSKNKKIRIIENKKNIGVGMSRNLGIEASKGKYIAFLDADDEWKKNKLNIQIKFMTKNKILISHTSYNIINENRDIIGTRIAKNFFDRDDLLKSCDIGLSTVVLEKKIYNKNCKFSKFKTKEDFIFWLKILNRGYKIYGLNKKLGIWNKTKNSLSSSVLQKLKDGFNVYYTYMNFGFFKSLVYLIFLSFNYIKKDFSKWS